MNKLGYRLAHSLTGRLGPIMQWSRKIRNYSLCRKIFEHCHLIQNFPPVRYVIKNSARPFSIWLQCFFLQMCNLSLCSKIIEHCHFVQSCPPLQEMILTTQSDPSSLGYRIFFFKWSQKIRNLSFYLEKYMNIATLFVSPSVRQSVSPSVHPSKFAYFVLNS